MCDYIPYQITRLTIYLKYVVRIRPKINQQAIFFRRLRAVLNLQQTVLKVL